MVEGDIVVGFRSVDQAIDPASLGARRWVLRQYPYPGAGAAGGLSVAGSQAGPRPPGSGQDSQCGGALP